MTTRPVIIAGGGLAGLALGLGLLQRGVRAVVHEAGTYPRHRVCGEFISGRGQAVLTRLGLDQLLDAAGAVPVVTAVFGSARRRSPSQRLPTPARAISRLVLDQTLARQFVLRGGDLREHSRWPGDWREGVVRATGRRLRTVTESQRWFGMKAHLRGAEPGADLEMHLVPRGYVGLCRLGDGVVNVCGLFRRSHSRGGAGSDPAPGPDWLRGPAGSALRDCWGAGAAVPGSFCAVAGIDLTPERAANRGDCGIGDALTMIPPVTGNGMSMALEAAELAVDPLVGWSRGDLSWEETRRAISGRCDRAFASRLRWARLLQRVLLTRGLADGLVAGISRSPALWRLLFDRTR